MSDYPYARTVPAYSPRTRVSLRELIARAEPGWHNRSNDALLYSHQHGDPASILRGATQELRMNGIDLVQSANVVSVDDVFESVNDTVIHVFLHGAFRYLQSLAQSDLARSLVVSPGEFLIAVNAILERDGVGMVLTASGWKPTVANDEEALLRALLTGMDDVATFRQGDVQVEMVAASVQSRLATQGTVIVDYGVGLGRFLVGLGTANRFPYSTYIGVDEPVDERARNAGRPFGGTVSFMSRGKYLASPPPADVVVMLNTLHHIPFNDLARQFSVMIGSLKLGGLLLLHEMNEHRHPERLNLPWRYEHIAQLLNVPGISVNPRTTTSKSGVPLSHVMVEPTGSGAHTASIQANVTKVWDQMKKEVLQDIDRLYTSGTPDDLVALRSAMIWNANLDLNQP